MDELVRNEFLNVELGLRVRTIENEDGSISISAEDTAIGFGWTQTQTKSGKAYTSVRWERMNDFSKECGFPHMWGKNDYIPESLFYMLGMKANNETALKYQKWLAFEILPSIRQYGGYLTSELRKKVRENPNYIIELADELDRKEAENKLLKSENENLKLENEELEQANELITHNYNDIQLMKMNTTNEVAEYVEDNVKYVKGKKVKCIDLYNHYYRWCDTIHHYGKYTKVEFEELLTGCAVSRHPIIKDGNYYMNIEVIK